MRLPELRDPDHVGELEVVTLERKLDEIRIERRRPDDDRVVVDDLPAVRPRQHEDAVDLLECGCGGGPGRGSRTARETCTRTDRQTRDDGDRR